MRGTKTLAALAVALTAGALAAGSARAITNGQPDGTDHPNVGAVIADLPFTGKSPVCSGTLISPIAFLTAGHCTAYLTSLGITQVWVSFDSKLDPGSWTLIPGTYETDPAFGHDRADLHDLGVVVLAQPVTWIAPATLPPAGLLDQIAAHAGLRGETFTNVGYGFSGRVTGGGPPRFLYDGLRRVSVSLFAALTSSSLRLLGNRRGTDLGGVCYGDSGGPHFLTGSSTIVAITSGGDAVCSGMSANYRLDTPSARAFLGRFVTLP